MNLLNGSCNHCIYGDGKPLTCSKCEGMLRGGFCLPCNLKAENSFICYQNAYSFNDTSKNSNYLPQPQYKNYLCTLCGNNLHDGYDCHQQFSFVYELEPSYNQKYNDNYYPHDSPSFPCYDNCGESHETFQCQPMDQNVDFFGSDQIQTPQYPEIYPPLQEISDEVFHAKGDLMKSIQTFLEEFNYIPFEEKPKILLQAWDKFFAIQHAQLEDSNELFQKLLEDLQIINKEMVKCNRPIFFDNNKDHSVQNKEYLENYSNEIAASNSNQEEPPQDSNIRQLIREECCIEVSEEQKQNMKNTILELVENCRQKELYCMHDNELVPILNECEVTSEDKRECDVLVCENSPICDDHSKIFSDSNNDDFEDIEHCFREKLLSINRLIANIEYLNDNPTPDLVLNFSVSIPIFEESNNSISDNFSPEFETFCDHSEETRSGNTTTHADDSLSKYDSFCFEIEPDQERLINVMKNDMSDDSTNDPLLEEVDLFLASDNSIPPGIENFTYDSKGNIRFLEELLIDDSILFPNNEASDFDNPSFPRPPQEPPDAEFNVETNSREEILVVMNTVVEFECLYPRDEFDKDNFSPEFETFCDHSEETRSGNTTTHADDSLPKYDSFCFEIEPDQERLINVVKNDMFDDSTNDPLLEEVDLFLASDNSIPPGIENFTYDSKGNIRFLKELLIDDSILFPNNEASDFDNPSFPRPPPEPPHAEFNVETNSREEILVVMNIVVEFELRIPSLTLVSPFRAGEETRSGNTTTHADDSLPKYDSFCFEIEPDQERLINVVKNDMFDDSTNDPLLEEVDLFLASDNSIPPGIENFTYDSKGNIRFLKELLIDDSILFPNNEASDFDNPSFPRPPPEPPHAEFNVETNSREEILVVMNIVVEFECLYPRDEFDVSNDENDDYL
nr:hypothetical protein [Tanacetum cinerariifolium]